MLFRSAFVPSPPPNSPSPIHPLSPDSAPSTPQPSEPAPPAPQPPGWPGCPLTPLVVVGGGGEAGKYCCLCGAWFNNPLMAQQHYEGKKHRRNAARVHLLEQLAGSLDATETTGQGQGSGVRVGGQGQGREIGRASCRERVSSPV